MSRAGFGREPHAFASAHRPILANDLAYVAPVTVVVVSAPRARHHGNPYVRVLRRQLEAYIADELGDEYLRSWQKKPERREITREIAELRKRLDELEARRAQIEGPD